MARVTARAALRVAVTAAVEQVEAAGTMVATAVVRAAAAWEVARAEAGAAEAARATAQDVREAGSAAVG